MQKGRDCCENSKYAHYVNFVAIFAFVERLPNATLLLYESSTLILYKELSSSIFQSCQSVSQSVRHW